MIGRVLGAQLHDGLRVHAGRRDGGEQLERHVHALVGLDRRDAIVAHRRRVEQQRRHPAILRDVHVVVVVVLDLEELEIGFCQHLAHPQALGVDGGVDQRQCGLQKACTARLSWFLVRLGVAQRLGHASVVVVPVVGELLQS